MPAPSAGLGPDRSTGPGGGDRRQGAEQWGLGLPYTLGALGWGREPGSPGDRGLPESLGRTG